ncbi:MAG: hypothetical protein H6975_05090 [Gammaproteobacteria bacterium]|nr:hypothetical protein [Gammaproteobacteria bacterium]
MKIRHTLLALLVLLAIAFMQPLVFFMGGLTLLFGVGALIFRDLSPTRQEAVENWILGWLRRARSNTASEIEPLTMHRRSSTMTATSGARQPERARRVRNRTASAIESDSALHAMPDSLARDDAIVGITSGYKRTPPAT